MSGFLRDLLKALRRRRGTDMRFVCERLLSDRGEASQTALAQEIISTYKSMDPARQAEFFAMLCEEFSPDEVAIHNAATEYHRNPDANRLAVLCAAVEPPRQELIRRINTAPHGTETLVAMRGNLSKLPPDAGNFAALDADLKHLFRSWFNRGFLRLERISWKTSAAILEKLIRYESVHEINGWPDLHRRLEADRRCFAFFHPALAGDPIIFVEVALTKGLAGDLGPLLDIQSSLQPPEKANTAIFYSINNCLLGLRGIPFGNFLIKQVVQELAAELPNIRNYSTLSPLPQFARALRDQQNEQGFTPKRLAMLLNDYAEELTAAAGERDPVKALFHLLDDPIKHQKVLSAPLERLGLAYLTKVHRGGKLYDPVAIFHLSNGACIERVNAFGNVRPYGLKASFGVAVNYNYVLNDVEENHERFVREGEIRVSRELHRKKKIIDAAWLEPAKVSKEV